MIRSDLLPLAFSFSLVSLRFSFVSVLIISMKNAEAVRHPQTSHNDLHKGIGSCLLVSCSWAFPVNHFQNQRCLIVRLMFFVSQNLGLKTLTANLPCLVFLSQFQPSSLSNYFGGLGQRGDFWGENQAYMKHTHMQEPRAVQKKLFFSEKMTSHTARICPSGRNPVCFLHMALTFALAKELQTWQNQQAIQDFPKFNWGLKIWSFNICQVKDECLCLPWLRLVFPSIQWPWSNI